MYSCIYYKNINIRFGIVNINRGRIDGWIFMSINNDDIAFNVFNISSKKIWYQLHRESIQNKSK